MASVTTLATSRASANEITFIEALQNGVDGVAGLSGASDPAVSPDGRHVYVASYASSAVAIFARDTVTGTLTYLGAESGLTAAFGVDVSPDGAHVYVASPTGSAIVALARDADTGLLTRLQDYTNPGGTGGFVTVTASHDGRYVYGVGGSPSGLVVWSRDASTGLLTFVADYRDNVDGHLLGQHFGPTTSPINNIAVSSDLSFLYITSTADNAVSVYAIDATTGELSQASTVVDGIAGVDGIQAASSLVLSPDNNFLYVSGQGEHSVAIFSRDATTGALTYLGKRTDGVDGVETLAGARSLARSPDGRYVYVSAITDNSITVFNRDAVTGDLSLAMAATQGVNGVSGIQSVSGMVTDPLSRHLYAAGQGVNSVAVFSLPIPAVVLSTTTITVDENGPAAVLDANLQVFDSDDPTLADARVFVASGFVVGDTLSVTPQGNITANYDSATGTLWLTGVDTLATYQAVLRTVSFQAGNDTSLETGQTATKVVSFQVFDGANESAAADVTITVNGVSGPSTYTVTASASGNGTIGPASAIVARGSTATFNVVPASGASIQQVTGCGGTLSGNTYTTAPITSACAVTATFVLNSSTVNTKSSGGGGSFDLLLLLAACVLLALRKQRRVVLSAVALGAMSSAGAAEDTASRWYVAASIGQAHGDIGSGELTSALRRDGYDVTAKVDHHDRFAWQVRGGYQWTRYLAIEAGYADLGDVEAEITGAIVDVPGLLASVNERHPHAPQGFEAAIVGRLPVNEIVSVTARAGAWRWESEFDVRSAGFVGRDRDGVDAVYGAGALFDVWSRMSIHAEWNRYHADRERIDVYGAGLKFHF
ncbi:beta-propeller fold lactonase family protein [Steroidobacter cummioxidans]|uniref:beta-propeller fold lactonase family protein n=1 Tax=Steroidobacter cummioxidans TaxID=1803913 RepID=UPI000E314F8B|nr:beta-propeller fold lactonase family protein [Steroidobacter cummioxidans]